jgi:uncharacterized protein (TIGR02231 family)
MAIKQQWTVLAALAASSASAVEAPIQQVTLYPGSATVERVVQVAPGMREVEITGLLANFNTETIRLQADPGIQVGQVVTRDQARADSPSPREAELEARVQALQDQIALVDAEIKAAQTAQAYLERLGAGEPRPDRAPADARTLLGTLDAIRKGAGDALQRMHSEEIKKRALTKQLDALKNDLAKVQANSRESRSMTIAVSAHQAGKLVLSYQVHRAGWKPSYRASLDSQASTVELERLASISQKTGEDWSRVKLRLSTGQPSLAAHAPEPGPWLLTHRADVHDTREGVTSSMSIAPPPPPAPVVVSASRAKAAAQVDDYVAPILESQGTFTTEYEVPARVDLASDGREISVSLGKQPLQVKQQVRIAPRRSDAAVLTAEAARPEGVWLPGQVQLRRDGSYVGSLYWNPQGSERFMMSFGRDPLVRVKVEHRDAKSGQAGIFNQANEKRIADAYAVTNLHRQPIDILVLEPTPVSQSDRIRAKVALDPEPGIKDWEQRRGVVGWEKTLKPNETARFQVDYVIDYPKDGTVRGLP